MSVENEPRRIAHEDVTLRVTEDGPALHIGDTEILLRTFVKVEDEADELWGERTVECDVQIDCDGDNGCWFILTPDDGDGLYPWVDIQPEIRYLSDPDE